jgi:transposase
MAAGVTAARVYWKSPFAALEAVGIIAWVVNARHVKAVRGRKTDMADAQWLATLARAGLLRASFIPPRDFRELRLVARQRQKLVGVCSAEKNRLHKVLVDAGLRINVLVADIHGSSARAMVKALVAGQPMDEVLDRKGRLRASREELFEALSTEQFSAVHRFVAEEILQHIEQIEQRIARMDQYLLEGLKAWQPQLNLLQTIPGIDIQGAAMLLVEIGADMTVFGGAERLASWVGPTEPMANRGPCRRPRRRIAPGRGGVVVWQFSSDFADKQRDRVERLSAWLSYCETVDAVIATSTFDPGSVIWMPRKSHPREAHRIELKVRADHDAVDALFNSAQGYRARFAASIEDGEAANRQIVDALVAKHLAAVAGSDEDRRRSLHATRAKVWGIPGCAHGRGDQGSRPRVAYAPWPRSRSDRVRRRREHEMRHDTHCHDTSPQRHPHPRAMTPPGFCLRGVSLGIHMVGCDRGRRSRPTSSRGILRGRDDVMDDRGALSSAIPLILPAPR